jgi:hypothetical protein
MLQLNCGTRDAICRDKSSVLAHWHFLHYTRSAQYGYMIFYYYRISHFSALAGKYSPILGFSNQQD